jgi:prepilin-type N-terminal cleavage/methylation domain-containing protein
MNKEFAKREGGFSLVELIIAMTITLVVLGIATTLLGQAFRVRSRANDNVDALADAERALNIMSRELSQAGFNLTDNGIVDADSITDGNGNSTIRVRANLNKFNTSFSSAARSGIGTQGEDSGEDIKYFIYPAVANNTTLLARYDAYAAGGGASTVLANKLDSMHVHYFAQKVTYNTPNCGAATGARCCDISEASAAEVSPSASKYLVIAVCVTQDAVGVAGSPGYQPASRVLLTSDVALRNANLTIY